MKRRDKRRKKKGRVKVKRRRRPRVFFFRLLLLRKKKKHARHRRKKREKKNDEILKTCLRSLFPLEEPLFVRNRSASLASLPSWARKGHSGPECQQTKGLFFSAEGKKNLMPSLSLRRRRPSTGRFYRNIHDGLFPVFFRPLSHSFLSLSPSRVSSPCTQTAGTTPTCQTRA